MQMRAYIDRDRAWIYETLHEDQGYRQGFRYTKILHHDLNEHFELLVFDSVGHGRVLMLDGAVQLTTRDEFIYHEMLTHVPILAHSNVDIPKSVLIIGGGDGGMARHALMHPNTKVAQVEISHAVVDIAKTHFKDVCGNVYADPRFRLIIADGKEYVASTDQQYDIIITDLTDPIGPAAELFELPFYRNCKRILRKGGILVTQNGVPFMQGDELSDVSLSLQSLFGKAGNVCCYIATVPTYVGGPMAFGWACDDLSKGEILDQQTVIERYNRSRIKTRYYNPLVHTASFCLPKYIQDLVLS